MMKEIFDNGCLQILYDDFTGECSLGWRTDNLTTLEILLLSKLFKDDDK